jgi:outer membrane protein assembly factor BamB
MLVVYGFARIPSALLLAAILAACGGGGHMSSASPSSPPPQGGGDNPPPTPVPAPSQPTDVTTYKYDISRSGQDLKESILTTANVNSASFGLLRILSTDGQVDAQPLYLSKLTVQGATHDVVFAATENDSVYAFDPDSGATLWQVSLLGSGETPSDPQGCGQITPTIGITATPVIDRAAGAHGTLYAVAMSRNSAGKYFQRLHALDVTTGAELQGGPVSITADYPANGAPVSFEPRLYAERAALLLSHGRIYASFTSHCDARPYSGWVIGFDEKTLARSAVFNAGPNSGGKGPAIWMSGGGPAADAAGNVYLLTANGGFETAMTADGYPLGGDYGNSFLKLDGTTLQLVDYFALSNAVAESQADEDLGSGGILLLPDLTDAGNATHHLAVGAGKDGNLYVVSRDSMGKFDPNGNDIWQQLDGALPGGIWSTPAYYNHTLYYGPNGRPLMSFVISGAKLAASAVVTPTHFVYPGTSPVVSADGASNGIVWAHENQSLGVLHAYEASNLAHELWNSSQDPTGRDHFGAGNKFTTPAVADGRVFLATQTGVAVFGLLPH